MSVPAWPTALPLPTMAGYSVTMLDANNARGGGSFGPVKSRNRFTRQSAQIPVSYMMTDVQFGIFEAWWHWIINDGAGWFQSYQDGETYALNDSRFVGGYQAAMQGGGHWAVSALLLIDQPARV